MFRKETVEAFQKKKKKMTKEEGERGRRRQRAIERFSACVPPGATSISRDRQLAGRQVYSPLYISASLERDWFMEDFNTAVTGAPESIARGIFVPRGASSTQSNVPRLPHDFWEGHSSGAGQQELPLTHSKQRRGDGGLPHGPNWLSTWFRRGVMREKAATESSTSAEGESTNAKLRRSLQGIDNDVNARKTSSSSAGGLGIRPFDGSQRDLYTQLAISAAVVVGAVSQTLATSVEVPGLSTVLSYAPALSNAFSPKLSMLPTSSVPSSLDLPSSSSISADMDLVSLQIQ